MIERYLLRYFLAVVDEGGFGRAAGRCHVSQPTLSVGIAKLEALVGTPLLTRTRRDVRLTPAGTRFLRHARRIESEFLLARAVATDDEAPAAVRLGVATSIPGAEIAAIVAAARGDAPDERFELVPGTARDLAAKLTKGRIDVALTILPDGDHRSGARPLRQEGFRLALPPGHPLAARAVVAAEDVADAVMIVRRHCESLAQVSRHFADRGIQPHFAYRATNDERVVQLIAAGLGVTVMPERCVTPDIRGVRLSGLDIRRTVGLAWPVDRDASPDTAIVRAAVAIVSAG